MKVAASPRIYMGRCPKVVFKLQVTSHKLLGTPNPKPRIPAFKFQGSRFRAVVQRIKI